VPGQHSENFLRERERERERARQSDREKKKIKGLSFLIFEKLDYIH
jgi:hypothetical protein